MYALVDDEPVTRPAKEPFPNEIVLWNVCANVVPMKLDKPNTAELRCQPIHEPCVSGRGRRSQPLLGDLKPVELEVRSARVWRAEYDTRERERDAAPRCRSCSEGGRGWEGQALSS